LHQKYSQQSYTESRTECRKRAWDFGMHRLNPGCRKVPKSWKSCRMGLFSRLSAWSNPV